MPFLSGDESLNAKSDSFDVERLLGELTLEEKVSLTAGQYHIIRP